LPVIISAMFDKLFKHEFWPILKLGSLLKEGLCLKGMGLLGVSRRGRGSSCDMVTAYRPDAPGALYQEPVRIGL